MLSPLKCAAECRNIEHAHVVLAPYITTLPNFRGGYVIKLYVCGDVLRVSRNNEQVNALSRRAGNHTVNSEVMSEEKN